MSLDLSELFPPVHSKHGRSLVRLAGSNTHNPWGNFHGKFARSMDPKLAVCAASGVIPARGSLYCNLLLAGPCMSRYATPPDGSCAGKAEGHCPHAESRRSSAPGRPLRVAGAVARNSRSFLAFGSWPQPYTKQANTRGGIPTNPLTQNPEPYSPHAESRRSSAPGIHCASPGLLPVVMKCSLVGAVGTAARALSVSLQCSRTHSPTGSMTAGSPKICTARCTGRHESLIKTLCGSFASCRPCLTCGLYLLRLKTHCVSLAAE